MTAGKLGRVRPTSRQRAMAPRLRDFVTAPLPMAPDEFHGATGAAIDMFGNDRYGCCVVAGAANYRAIRAQMTKQPAPPSTTEAVVTQYLKLSPNDEGLNESEFLNTAKHGVELGGPTWQDAVWTTVDGADRDMCRSLIAIFGALYLGVELPTDAQRQEVWTPTRGRGGAPGGWGGHALLWSGFDADHDDLVTWGSVQLATPDWLPEYGDEFHVIVDSDSAAIAGIDFEKLVAYANETSL